jgi:hypothetical protein
MFNGYNSRSTRSFGQRSFNHFLKKHIESGMTSSPEDPGVFEVERIIGRRVLLGQEEFRVQWVGFPESEATWEPVDVLSGCAEILEAFRRRENKNQSRRSRTILTDDREVDLIIAERQFGARREFLVRWLPSETLVDKVNWVPEQDLHCDEKLSQYFRRREQIVAPTPLLPTVSDVAPGTRIVLILSVLARTDGKAYVVKTEDGADWILPSPVVRAEAPELLAGYLEALAAVMGPDVEVDPEGFC